MPKLQRAISQEVFFKISSKVNQVVYSSLPVYSSSFKALASIVFEIFCWQDCIHIFSKGHNSEKGHNPVKKKKYMSAIFSWGIHIRNFITVAFTVLKLCYASKNLTNERTEGQTEEQPRSNMPLKLLWSWRHNNATIIGLYCECGEYTNWQPRTWANSKNQHMVPCFLTCLVSM